MEIFFAKTDQVFNFIAGHSVLWIYSFVLIVMIIENFFPPFPGDTCIFICGIYAASGDISWLIIYLLSVIGTLISVMALFYIGRKKGRNIFLQKSMRWLHPDRLGKIEKWFSRWGEKLLLASRMLTGMRALLALFAGVGKVRTSIMFIYSLISTLIWNFLVLWLAYRLRNDWHYFDKVFGVYNSVIFLIFAVVLIVVISKFIKRRKADKEKV